MQINSFFSRANQDRVRSKKTLEKYKRKFKNKPKQKSYFNFWDSQYSEYKTRTIAPYAFLIYCSTILFGFMLYWTSVTTFIQKSDVRIYDTKLKSIILPNDNTIYKFNIDQQFRDMTPLYSELEIELLDENYNHVFSFYKDLWKEKYSNDEGRMVIYSDTKLVFELDIKSAGIYYLRANSHNNNKGKLIVKVYEKKANMYFYTFFIFFSILSVLLIFSAKSIGNPLQMFLSLTKLKNIKNNKKFILVLIIVIFVFVSCIFISLTHYGYPYSGDKIRLPTYFFNTNDVIYLG